MISKRPIRIGLIGSGYIARGLITLLACRTDLTISKVLTRCEPTTRSDFPAQNLLTNSIHDLIDHSDLAVECSGDVLHGTAMLLAVMDAELPVVTLDPTLQVTTGSYFVDKGFITEAEGYAPGSLAALHEEVIQMGFKPLVYGNSSNSLNKNPHPDVMLTMAKKQGVSLNRVVAAIDGTQTQFEQVLVANGLGADIAKTGLLYLQADTLEEGANLLAALAKGKGTPLADCLVPTAGIGHKLPADIFVTAEHEQHQQEFLRYYQLGDGPYYTLRRSYCLPHLDLVKTICRVVHGGGVLLTNSATPRFSVAARAKRALKQGERIEWGIGSFDVRGVAVRITEHPGHVPIGLLQRAVVKHALEPGQLLTFADLEFPNSIAKQAWLEIEQSVTMGVETTSYRPVWA
ncbi:MAG: hypothetical protein R3C14_01400 [Caldilineaceae bacterium]